MKRALLTAVTALMVVGQAGLAADDLDAFVVYRVNESETEHNLSLEGQFDEQPIPATLNRLVSIAKAVGIDGEPINDQQRHLTWYRLEQASEERLKVVDVENRFGQLRLTLGQPVALLAPAENKTAGGGPPAGLDHFKVYEVRQVRCVDRADQLVDLQDPAGEDQQVEVRFPRFFAVPVEKTVGGQPFPIQNAADHLTIYEIQQRDSSLGQMQVEDQFGTHDLTINRRELLCVPSRKQEIAPPQGLDHFQIDDVTDHPVDHQLELRGQFDKAGVETQLHRLTHLATAASKNDEPLVDEDARFTVYRISQEVADPIRMVHAWNQFGEQQLWIGAAHLLLVPARRTADGAATEDLDHYVCYPVVRPCSFLPTRVKLDDGVGDPQEVSVTTPMLFCVPVAAVQGDIHDEKHHLVLYRISPRPEAEQDELEVEDRFGVRTLTRKRTVMLAVPTLKFEVFPPLQTGEPAGN